MVICSYLNTCKMYIIHIPHQISEYINIKYCNTCRDPIGAFGTIGHNTRTIVYFISIYAENLHFNKKIKLIEY